MTAFPLAFLLGGAALMATSLIGWSVDVEASALERVSGDKWLLAISAVAGGATGALLAWALTSRTLIVLGGALVGVVPALIKASAYFTNAY